MKNETITLLFFDSECLFCNFWVQFILKKDKKKKIYFAPLQSSYAEQYLFPIIGEKYKQFDTLYLYQDGEVYEKSQAILKICYILDGYFRFFLIFKIIPIFILNFFYDIVAKNRHNIVTVFCTIVEDPRILK
jgi:predicted DCC family thiol-disulfide oxidoreductase YuxK